MSYLESLINNERIGYGLNILCCYIIGHLGTLRFEIFYYAVDRDKLSYIICKKENQVFQKFNIADLFTGYDVFKDYRVVDPCKYAFISGTSSN